MIKASTSDPESGWYRKGKHKCVFTYAVETACNMNGWILGYTVHPGNLHDSRTFKSLYDKIKNIGIETLTTDAGYKMPGIAKLRCLYLGRCTESKDHVKVDTRHIWEPYMENCEDIHTLGMKALFAKRNHRTHFWNS